MFQAATILVLSSLALDAHAWSPSWFQPAQASHHPWGPPPSPQCPPPAAAPQNTSAAAAWTVAQFASLITFGDSYTDESRLSYFINHNGPPPAGTILPETFNAPSGGRTWPRYVVQYTGQTVAGAWTPQLQLYDYAVSGAVCSNDITPRLLSAALGDFPAVLQYEIPAFIADAAALRTATPDNATLAEPYFTPARTAANAVYALWIGTNDLGNGAFLTDSQVPGNTLTDYTDCVFAVLDALYAQGARYLVLFNNAPLWLAPLYANASEGGVGDNKYWADKPANLTAISLKMEEEVTSVNQIFNFQLPFEKLVANRYPGANFALYNVNQLMLDIHASPADFLNGTAPLNVTGFENHCNDARQDCVRANSPDSFMWFDELHPSEQTDRIIARNFVNVLAGTSQYATYW